MSVGKLFALKTVIAVVSLSGGGVALAAATGNLPAQSGGHSSSPSSTQSASASATRATRAPGNRSAATPSPAMHGLCQAFQAGAGSNPGKALSNPAFTALINAAGGKANVSSYCAGVLASSPSAHSHANPNRGSSDHSQGQSAHPTPHASQSHPATGSTDHSGSGPSDMHGTSQPTVEPTGNPAAHPTGKPSAHPAAP